MDAGKESLMAMNQGKKPKLVFFGHNRKDAAIVRRAEALEEAGVDVAGFMYRRDGEPAEPAPSWSKVDLGYVEHCKHLQRLMTHARAIARIFTNRRQISEADVVFARNLDMMGMALLGVLFARAQKLRIVYEVLDVHVALTKAGLPGKVLRWLERAVLKRVDLLIVSSPGFLRNYFVPMQSYQGPHYLIENKLHLAGRPLNRPSPDEVRIKNGGPLVLAWVGILRCQKTLDVLKALAEAEGDAVEIRLHGVVSDFLIDDFHGQISKHPNVVFKGAYVYPVGLIEAYKDVDFVWAQELSWSGHNSDWLLPNRIYEGSYFGALSLAVEGTETARTVAERQLGYVLPDASASSVSEFIRSVDREEVAAKRRAILSRDPSEFSSDSSNSTKLARAIVGMEWGVCQGIAPRDGRV